MPTIAELVDRGTAERLAAVQAQAGQRQAEAKAAPVQAATCQACGQRLPAPAAVFRSGAEQRAALNQET
jgi:hypothetical protein